MTGEVGRGRTRCPLLSARATLPVIGLLAALFATPLPASQQGRRSSQQPPPTFRAEVNYVEVDVMVTDSRGNFVENLSRDDFEVREDGRPQEVATFMRINLPHAGRSPASQPASTGIEGDVRSNAAGSEGRVFLLVLDDLHTDPLRSVQVRQAASRFIERYVGLNDLVSVIHTSGRSDASQEFTPNASLLLASVEKFAGRKLRSAVLERVEQYHRQQDRETRADIRLQHVLDPLESERGRRAEQMLETLQRLADLLSGTSGRRKSVILISEGIDYDVQDAVKQTTSGVSTLTSTHAQSLANRARLAIGALTRANVTVYGVDPRGLGTGADDLIGIASFPESPLLGLSPHAFQDELRRAQDSLGALSQETGGFAAVNANDFADAFERIIRENSSYYLLGYRSNNTGPDGSFRTIAVRVKRPDVHVRARSGYFGSSSSDRRGAVGVTSEEPTDALRRILNDPLPATAVPLRAFAAPFKGAGQNGSVLFGLEIDSANFRFGRENGLYTNSLEAAVVALDYQGRFYEGGRHSVALQLKPETYEAVRTNGLRVLFRLNLPHGRYQLRAAARDAGSGAIGSVHYDVDVPDFTRRPLSLSGVVLTTASAAAVPTPSPDPELQALLRSSPAGAREFMPAENLTAFFVIYHDGREPVRTADLTIAVARAGDGRVQFESRMQVSDHELRAAPDGYGCIVAIPLLEMTEGAYVLRVQAKPRGGEEAMVVRELPFRVRAADSTIR